MSPESQVQDDSGCRSYAVLVLPRESAIATTEHHCEVSEWQDRTCGLVARKSLCVCGSSHLRNAEDLERASKRTNFHGEVKVDVTGANPPEVKVWVDFISRDCRFTDQQARPFTYSRFHNERSTDVFY